jgi:hypothetical protein
MTETKEESCQTKYNRKKPVISGRVDPTTKQAFVRAAQKRNIKPNKLHSDERKVTHGKADICLVFFC